MPTLTAHHIKSIRLVRLFGRYTYTIPRGQGLFDVLNILYGENGAGKTTLLNLLYHLLSPAPGKGHKNYVAGVPFERLEVVLQDGTMVSADKDPQLLSGPTTFTISAQDVAASWKFLPNASPQVRVADLPENIDLDRLPNEIREEVARSLAQREYFRVLAQLRVTPVMLTSDRILLADSLDVERRRRSTSPLPERTLAEVVAEQRIEAVSQALRKASGWIQEKFYVRAQRASSVSYENVVNRIAETPYKTSVGLSRQEETAIRGSLSERIRWINERSGKIKKFGIGGGAVSETLLATIDSCAGNKLHLVDNVLSPHLDEIMERLHGLWPVYELVDGFVNIVNRFFRDKQITYSLVEGLKIVSTGTMATELKPQHLSSGEQQLMLIFCYVLTSRDSPSIFIIDEPEISLNILWQRMLVSSLEELAGQSDCQFLFASHSMEILAKHSGRVLDLQQEQEAS